MRRPESLTRQDPPCVSVGAALPVGGPGLEAVKGPAPVGRADVPADSLGMAKDVMGAKNAKRYFGLIGGSAAFIFFSNVLALIPGFTPPTSNLNVTLGYAILVFLSFNYWGLKENGWGYLAHLAGPKWYLAPLIFPIEVISTCVRPVTLSIRLMINMAVDHLVASIFLGMIAFLVPVPLMFLAIIVVVVQTLVFCLLSMVYINMAVTTHEHDDHGHEEHGEHAHSH